MCKVIVLPKQNKRNDCVHVTEDQKTKLVRLQIPCDLVLGDIEREADSRILLYSIL